MDDVEKKRLRNAEIQRAWKARNPSKVKRQNKAWNDLYRKEYQRKYRVDKKKQQESLEVSN